MAETVKRFALLNADELDTIEAIARNGQSGRVTEYEITELVAGYRAASEMLLALLAVADLKGWNEKRPISATGIQVMNAIAKAEGRS